LHILRLKWRLCLCVPPKRQQTFTTRFVFKYKEGLTDNLTQHHFIDFSKQHSTADTKTG